MSCLAPCPACNRHVSTHEAACPFCAASLPESFRCAPARVQPPGRLSRTALVAAGAALVSVACNSVVAAYGIAVGYDASADTSPSDADDGAGANDTAAALPAPALPQFEPTPPDGESAPPPKKR